MNKDTAAKLATEIRELADKKHLYTKRDIRLFTEKDHDGDYEIKVFEINVDGTISSAILTITELVTLATKFETSCIVKVEWRDGKGTQGKPYFLFF